MAQLNQKLNKEQHVQSRCPMVPHSFSFKIDQEFEHTDRQHKFDAQLNNELKRSIVYKLHPVLFIAEAFVPCVDYSSAHHFERNQHH